MKPNGNSSPPIGKTVPTPGCLPAKKIPVKLGCPLCRAGIAANHPNPAMNPAASVFRAICSAKTRIRLLRTHAGNSRRRGNRTQNSCKSKSMPCAILWENIYLTAVRGGLRGSIGTSGRKHEYTGGKRSVKALKSRRNTLFSYRYPRARQTPAHHQSRCRQMVLPAHLRAGCGIPAPTGRGKCRSLVGIPQRRTFIHTDSRN